MRFSQTTALTALTASVVAAPSGIYARQNSSGKVAYPCINIAGFDFGCRTDGTCDTTKALNPLTKATPTADKQMSHFASADGFQAFRLPVSMQYVFNNNVNGPLDNTAFTAYNNLVTACTNVAQKCIIDFHNYARWNGAIFGQGGPTNAQFANLWAQVAARYAGNSKIVFGIMNEPHDIPNIQAWAATAQAAVTAIRNAGATSQIILLPGSDYTSAQQFISDGSGPALLNVSNLDGSKTNLIFDVHKYLDSDNSGTHTSCVTNNIDSSFSPLATWLRQNKRQAWNSETGGGNNAGCVTDLVQQISYLK